MNLKSFNSVPVNLLLFVICFVCLFFVGFFVVFCCLYFLFIFLGVGL